MDPIDPGGQVHVEAPGVGPHLLRRNGSHAAQRQSRLSSYSVDAGSDQGSAYVFERVRVEPQISITGVCLGAVTLSVTDGTPYGTVREDGSFTPGLTTLPPGDICAGTELDLEGAFQVGAPDSSVRTARASGPEASPHLTAVSCFRW